MSPSSWFCASGGGASGLPKDLATAAGLKDKTVLECDYDDNVTNLYSAIESGAWVPVLQFLQTGQWEHMFLRDPQPADRQARTWVTRFNPDGSVRWSQLPLHAALIFSAPKKIILKLVELYPLGVRCTDDQQMLPLHLAIKYGADDSILSMLLDKFPAALSTKDVRGRIPIDIDGPETTKERMNVLRKVVTVTTETIRESQGKFYHQKLKDLQDDLADQTRRKTELEDEKRELEAKLRQNMTDFAELQEDFDLFKEAMMNSNKSGSNKRGTKASTSVPPSIKSSSLPPPPTPMGNDDAAQRYSNNLPPPRPPPVSASKQMHREMVMNQSMSFDSTATGGSRSKLMQSPRSFVFGRSSVKDGSTIATTSDHENEQQQHQQQQKLGRWHRRERSGGDSSSSKRSWIRGKSTPPPPSSSTTNSDSNDDSGINGINNNSVSSNTTNTATAPDNDRRVQKQLKQQRKENKNKYGWTKSSQRGHSWVKTTSAAINDGSSNRKGHRLPPPRPDRHSNDGGNTSKTSTSSRANADTSASPDYTESRQDPSGGVSRVDGRIDNDGYDDDQEMIVSSSRYNYASTAAKSAGGEQQQQDVVPTASRSRRLSGFFGGFDAKNE